MNRFMKLLAVEFNRFSKILLGMLAITFLIQVIGVIFESKRYLKTINSELQRGLTKNEIADNFGPMSFDIFAGSLWFFIPIALCAGALFFYIFIIWYRDWTGKSTFIYRLLMLPTSRLTVYFAKAVSLMIFVLVLVAFQLAILPIEQNLMEWIVPREYVESTSLPILFLNHSFLSFVIPATPTQFFLYYGAGFVFVSVLFTGILLERSFQWKGIILAILYIVFAIGLFISPIFIIQLANLQYAFDTSDLILMLCGTGVFVFGLTIWLSRYLLNSRVTV